MATAKTFRYLSLGAGVQSSALYVMSTLGLRGVPRAEVAIFADTMAEPQFVYDHLAYLEAWGARQERPIPIERTSGGDLGQQILDAGAGVGAQFASIPSYVTGGDGRAAPVRRQCTREFKIDPIHRKVRDLLGYKPRQRMRHQVYAMNGISLDEVFRMKPSFSAWETREFPLVDALMTRDGCRDLLVSLGIPVPEKSACVFCPYHDDESWARLRDLYPAEWERACQFDDALRPASGPRSGLVSYQFLHRSMIPLRQVDLKPKAKAAKQRSLGDGFVEECEGMCGV